MKKISDKIYDKNRVYGIVGLVGLFMVGVIFGFVINGADRVNRSIMTEEQCQTLTIKLSNAVNNSRYDDIEKLNKIYSENCLDRQFRKTQPKPVVEEKLPDTTCEAIEALLKNELVVENSVDWQDHSHNSEVYDNLATNGCEKNKALYYKLSQREKEIAKALDRYDEMAGNKAESTCGEIERILIRRLDCADKHVTCMNAQSHVRDAQIYANLSERGCPENSQKYKDLAKQELDIARALTDDDIERNQNEATEMVETYKRLQMQQEATRMIEKAKKLTNPAIDFIIQLEKIIEE